MCCIVYRMKWEPQRKAQFNKVLHNNFTRFGDYNKIIVSKIKALASQDNGEVCCALFHYCCWKWRKDIFSHGGKHTSCRNFCVSPVFLKGEDTTAQPCVTCCKVAMDDTDQGALDYEQCMRTLYGTETEGWNYLPLAVNCGFKNTF